MSDLSRVERLREERAALIDKMGALTDAAEAEKRDLTDDEAAEFDRLEADADKKAGEIRRAETAAELKPQATEERILPAAEEPVVRAMPKGSRTEKTYRPDGDHSYFRDVVSAGKGDPSAWERLNRNNREQNFVETRAGSTTATAGGNFVVPNYLNELYAEKARAGRPFVDVLPKAPLPDGGMSILIPRITTGTLTAAQSSQNSSIGTQDVVEAQLNVPVVTVAGYNDISQQLLDRSYPGFDQIIFTDLRNDYDVRVDTAALSGAGSTTHLGVRGVSSINTVQYTDASPTAAELFPKVFDAIQKIASNRFQPATHIVMHPRRAAWLASNLSSTFPLFQQGGLYQAGGTQDGGMVLSFAGLPVILDANIATNYSDGGNTNEDEIYVVRASDMVYWEGPLMTRVDPYTVGLNLTVRLSLYGYSAFASGRFPASITKIYGSGLATPTF